LAPPRQLPCRAPEREGIGRGAGEGREREGHAAERERAEQGRRK